jgi:hypothetical protein
MRAENLVDGNARSKLLRVSWTVMLLQVAESLVDGNARSKLLRVSWTVMLVVSCRDSRGR